MNKTTTIIILSIMACSIIALFVMFTNSNDSFSNERSARKTNLKTASENNSPKIVNNIVDDNQSEGPDSKPEPKNKLNDPINEDKEQNKPSLEYMLASLDADRYIPEDHITVNRFRALLDMLSKKYPETKKEISDMTVKAQELMRDKGVEESLMNIMEGLNRHTFTPSIYNNYLNTITSYLTLREQGLTHSEVLLKLSNYMDKNKSYFK